MVADPTQMKHVVEARDRITQCGRYTHRVGDLADRVGGKPAVAFLCQSKRGNERGARVRWKAIAETLDEFVQLCAHRSTSPITVSRDPTIAIMSATSASRMQVAVA